METQDRLTWVATDARQILAAEHGLDSAAVQALDHHEAIMISLYEATHRPERDEINDRMEAFQDQDPELYFAVLGARREAFRRRLETLIPDQR